MTGRIRAILIEILDITNDVRYVVRLRITFRVGNSLYKCEVRMGRPFAAADGAGFVTRSPLIAFEPSLSSPCSDWFGAFFSRCHLGKILERRYAATMKCN
jgi:hypothetical protein